jgi:hypothetical protein
MLACSAADKLGCARTDTSLHALLEECFRCLIARSVNVPSACTMLLRLNHSARELKVDVQRVAWLMSPACDGYERLASGYSAPILVRKMLDLMTLTSVFQVSEHAEPSSADRLRCFRRSHTYHLSSMLFERTIVLHWQSQQIDNLVPVPSLSQDRLHLEHANMHSKALTLAAASGGERWPRI